MKLLPKEIAKLEKLLDMGGVVELRLSPKGVVVFSRRPEQEAPISFPAAIKCSDSPCRLNLALQNPGEDPINLQTFNLPANYWLTGISGYQEE